MPIYHVSKLNLEKAQKAVIWPTMTLTFDRLTFQMSKSEDNYGNLSNVVLSTLFSNPFG